MARRRAEANPKIAATAAALYSSFMAPGEIVDRLMTEFGLSNRTARRHVADQQKAAKEAAAISRQDNVEQMLATCRRAIAKCMAAGKYRDADRWAERASKIQGLYAATKVELTGGVGRPVAVSVLDTDERKALERALTGAG